MQRSPATAGRRYAVLSLVLAAGLSVAGSVSMADESNEKAQLALVLRQLEAIERTALHSQELAATGGRYHFDYARLNADIERVRTGVQDYLNPPRAQPRDSEPLSGSYRVESNRQQP